MKKYIIAISNNNVLSCYATVPARNEREAKLIYFNLLGIWVPSKIITICEF